MSIQITTDVSQLSDAEYGVLLAFMNDLRQLRREALAKREIAAHTHIAHDDRPDTGAPAASEVFGKAGTDEPNPASVFGGNGAPASAGAATSTTAPAASAATSTSTSAPLPPAAPPAPPAATAAQNTASPAELDKDGLPWDGRVHAESRAKIADQTWRRRRNITDEYYAQVVAELRAVMGNSGAPAASPVAPAPTSTPAASQTAVVVPPPPPPSTAPNANSTGNAPPTLPAASPSVSEGESQVSASYVKEFPKLCKRIAEAVNTNVLSNEALTAVLTTHNLPNLPTLAAFPHLVPAISEALGFKE